MHHGDSACDQEWDEKETVQQKLVKWSTAIDSDGNQVYNIDINNPIQYPLISSNKKAACLSLKKCRMQISDLKCDSTAPA